jgi:rare lipoprotein A
MTSKFIFAACAATLSLACLSPSDTFAQSGVASYYGPGFHGRRTANGERFDMHGLTAAHRSMPFGSKIQVTNLGNGKSVVLRVNDRGPYIHGRVLDVSSGAANLLGMKQSGTARVSIARL